MIYIFLLYAFLVPFEYIQEKIPKGPTGINYANLMMGLMIVFWVTYRTGKGRPLLLKTPLNIVILAFLAFTYFGIVLSSLSYSEIPSAFSMGSPEVRHFLQFGNAFLFFFFAANLIDSRKHIHWMMLTLAFAAPWVFRVFHSQLGSMLVWHYNHNLRIKGPFVWIGSNELGAFMLYSAVMLGLYAFYQKKPWLKWSFLLASFCYIYGILYSYSRATQLAFVVCCVILASLRYRWMLLVMILVAVSSSFWLPPSVADRWAMTRSEDGELDQSAQSREVFWELAVDLWTESPVVGIGVGAFKIRNEAGMDTHNIYFRTLCEQGLVGITLFMLIWWLILRMCYRLWRHAAHPHDRHYGFCLMIATIGLMIANYFGDRYTHLAMIGQYWVLVGMAARMYANMVGVEALEDETGDETSVSSNPVPAVMRSRPGSPAFGMHLLRPSFISWLTPRHENAGGRPAPSPALSFIHGLRPRTVSKSSPAPGPASRPSLNIIGKQHRASEELAIVGRPSPTKRK